VNEKLKRLSNYIKAFEDEHDPFQCD